MAARPRTLPLAVAPIALAGGLASLKATGFGLVLGLALLTAACLQLLSNFANDLGDAQKGTDDAKRLGPPRAVSSGLLSAGQMKAAVALTSLAAVASGAALLFLAMPTLEPGAIRLMFGVGALAILAALGYTLGKRPFGYLGLGDLVVLIFFGWVGVTGAYLLMAGSLDPRTLLPATGLGLLAAGVLHINNLRDREGDARHGKRTLAVRFGDRRARRYHVGVITFAALLLALTPVWIGAPEMVLAWLPALWTISAVRQAVAVARTREPRALNPFLGRLALLTALWGISLGLALAIGGRLA